MSKSYNLSFKRQIVSLRAISVLSVFFFHLNLEYFKNGYLGVDIFFLISGYVITQSLFKNWNGNKLHAILKFYVKRFKRVYPNLIFILIFVSLIFLLIIPLEHFLMNLKNVIYSLFGYSNIAYYLGGNDYFKDIDNPFLHTWSLGVETQIYIIFPFLFLFIISFKKIRNNDIYLYTLSLILFLSLFLFVYLFDKNQSLVFYFSIFRLWEFLLGSLIFFLDDRIKKNNFLANFSILIVLIILCLGDFKNFALINLITIFFASIYIVTFEKENYLNSKFVNFIGNISYSFYLWHLPLIFLLKYFFEISFISSLFIFLLTILVSWFTYNFIEKKFKNISYLNSNFIFNYRFIFTSIIIFVFLLYIYNNKFFIRDFVLKFNYFEKVFNWEQSKKFSKIYYNCVNFNLDQCKFKQNSDNNDHFFFIEGNSYAGNFLEMFHNSKIVENAFFSHISGSNLKKSKFFEYYDKIDSKFNLIYYSFVVQTFQDLEQLKFNLSKFKKFENNRNIQKINILILGAIPHISKGPHPIDCLKYSKKCYINVNEDRDTRSLDLLSNEIKKFISNNNDRSLIYYKPYFKLCSNETELCEVYLKKDKQLFFRDPTHLTIQGSKYLSEHFDNYFSKTLKLN